MLDGWLQRKKKLFYIILYDFIKCPAFVDIKQTLHCKVAIE